VSDFLKAAKGETLSDGTYVYKCGKCNGFGMVHGHACDWCYGLDIPRIVDEMKKGARGQRYYSLLKAFLSVNGKAMVDECHRIAQEQQKVTPVDIGYLSLKFGLNFKATWEWLEETRCLRTTYHLFTDSGHKVRDVYDKAREKYHLPPST
jgi:hypothetical protein